jgi:hypothetical protein
MSLLMSPQMTELLSTLKPPQTTIKVAFGSSLSTLTKKREIHTSQDNHKLGSSQAMPSHLGDESPRAMNANEVINEGVWNQASLKEMAPIFSQWLKNE